MSCISPAERIYVKQRYETVRGAPDFGAEKSGAETDHEGDRPHTPPEEMPAPIAASPPPKPKPTPAPVPAPVPQLAPTPIVAVVSSNGSALGPSSEEYTDLQSRLAEAQAELSRMRALLQSMPDPSLGGPVNTAPEPSVAPSQSVTEAGMRRRQRVLSDSSSTMGGSTYAPRSDVTGTTTTAEDYKVEVPEGVPLPIVIAVALGVFVTTYLFF
jgi:vesicle-associated membrane protein-associated protein A